MARYLFHNIYGDAQNLIDTLPADVETISWGWDPATETVREAKIAELNNPRIPGLPCLVYYRNAYSRDTTNPITNEVLTDNYPAAWFGLGFREIDVDVDTWTWEIMEQFIIDNNLSQE